MTQVILNGQRMGVITSENLATFLRVSTVVVVSYTATTICLMAAKGGAL